MAFFEWGDDLSVGNESIDRDHQRLIGLVNDLHTATQKGEGREVVGAILDGLLDYTREHFQREETHMQHIGYAQLESHRGEHGAILQKVQALRAQCDSGHLTIAVKVSTLLREWLSIHIMRSDKAFASQVRRGAAPPRLTSRSRSPGRT